MACRSAGGRRPAGSTAGDARLLGNQLKDRDQAVGALLVLAETRGALDNGLVDGIALLAVQFTSGRGLGGRRAYLDGHARVGANVVHPCGVVIASRRRANNVDLAVDIEVANGVNPLRTTSRAGRSQQQQRKTLELPAHFAPVAAELL